MKFRILLTAICALGFMDVFAVVVPSQVNEVVLYRGKARETRQVKVNLTEPGKQEIVLSNISMSIDPASLSASVNGGVVLLSASTKLNYLSPVKTEQQVSKWQDTLKASESDLAWLKEQIAVYQGELALLNANYKVGGDQTLSYSKAVEEMATLYRTRSLKVRESIFALQKQEKELAQKVQNLQQQIANSGSSNKKPVQEITLQVEVLKPGEVTVKCQYLVNGASWEPVYDLRAPGLNQPIQLEMKAAIRQNTGYDWNDVRLFLSTSNPNSNQSRPIMNPEYVDYQMYKVQEYRGSASAMNMAYAKSANAEVEDKIMEKYMPELEETAVAQLYGFKNLQDIKAGNEEQKILIQSEPMEAQFTYHAVPKKDLTAYLIAKVANWEKYNLLPGVASIFFEDTYVGQTTINPKVASDTLLLSMGRDELITIERTSVKDLSATKWIGSSKKEVKSFEIKVKNNKKTDVQLEILDQIPVSRQKDIEVVLESQDGAEYLAENGRLKWMLNLKPGETKKIRFTYSIKYTEGKPIYIGN